MKHISILLVVAASLVMTACAGIPGVTSTLGKTPPADRIGNGEYGVVNWPGGLPHVAKDEPGNEPASFGKVEGDQLVYLDRHCRLRGMEQVPSWFKSVGTTTVRTTVPIAVGGAGGTAKGIGYVAKGAKGYASYGAWSAGGSGAGAGLAGGIDRHLTGNRYWLGDCMTALVSDAKSRVGALKGTHIIFNADAVNGTPVKKPTGPSTPQAGGNTPDSTAEEDVAPHRP